MTGSQIKQEAPETNTFKMAEIEADDQWSLRSTMQGARIWLPNIQRVGDGNVKRTDVKAYEKKGSSDWG